MATHILKQVKQAVANLNPDEVRETAERPIHVGLLASSDASYENMMQFFCPSIISSGKLRECEQALHRATDPNGQFDVLLYDWENAGGMHLGPKAGAFLFDSRRPDATKAEILEYRQDLALPLARHFVPFRRPVVEQ